MEKWQLDALNFEVKAIETFLGIAFEGETVEQKQEFVAAHKDKRTDVTSELLRTAYKEKNLNQVANNMTTALKNHFEEQWNSNRFQFLYMEANTEVNRDYESLKAFCEQLKEKQVGEFIQFKKGKTKNFEIVVKNERFIIAASKSRTEYTIIDTDYGVCGPSNRTFGISVKSEESLKEAMEGLVKGEMYLSYRHSAPIDAVLV